MANFPIVVVFPLPLTPHTKTTWGLYAELIFSSDSTLDNFSSILLASICLISKSVISLSKRFFDNFFIISAAQETPISLTISNSSSWSRDSWSNFFLVKIPVIPPDILSLVLARPFLSFSIHYIILFPLYIHKTQDLTYIYLHYLSTKFLNHHLLDSL